MSVVISDIPLGLIIFEFKLFQTHLFTTIRIQLILSPMSMRTKGDLIIHAIFIGPAHKRFLYKYKWKYKCRYGNDYGVNDGTRL